ncbi:MAG: CpsD/CapB family tyrosine-protein kinase [Clostridia bacterium]|nr:CpsD/CapB family tyrosine-protein kinase [Clostridia bacterium]
MNTMKINLPGDDNLLVQEAVKSLRTNLQFCGQDVKVIQVTAYGEKEGKTTISMQIAKSFAELGKKVLLIDADMRKSVMAGRNTTAKPHSGLCEVLSGLAKLEDCLWQVENDGFYALFSGAYPPNPVELLSATVFGELVARMRDEYDYVIIDTPPLGMVIDAAVIAPQCDGSVVVLGDDKLKYRQVESVLDQLRKSGCRILGVVRNKRVHTRHGYYSTYRKNGKE